MVCKGKASRLVCGLAASAMVLLPNVVKAQDTSTTGTAASSTMAPAVNQPMLVSGTVLRYYVDRSGYVTAADIQTSSGVSMVRFAPGMGQRIYSTYPVGGQASVYVVGSADSGRWDVVSLGDQPPAAGFMNAYMVSDVDLLKAEPYIMVGSKMVQFSGKLHRVVTDDSGEVIGLILSGVNMEMVGNQMTGATGDMGMTGEVLVRVPREVRHPYPGSEGGSMRVTPLFRGANVEVVGYPEAPRYGVISRYGQRVAASALVVDGHEVGAVGVPKMDMESTKTLFNLDIMKNASEEEKRAGMMGYTTYDPNSMTMNPSTTTTPPTTTQ